jgi:hypothetical protein
LPEQRAKDSVPRAPLSNDAAGIAPFSYDEFRGVSARAISFADDDDELDPKVQLVSIYEHGGGFPRVYSDRR